MSGPFIAGMRRSPFFFVFLTVLLWAGIPVAGRLALNSISGFQLLLYMYLFASVTMAAVVALSKRTGLLKKYSARDFGKMFMLGAVGWFGLEAFYYYGLSYAPTVDVSVLNGLWPVFAVVLARPFLGERITERKLFAVALAFFGAALVIGPPLSLGGRYLFGYALAVLSGVAEAFFIVGGKKCGFEEYTSMLVYCLVAFFLSLVANVLGATLFIPSPGELSALLYLGVFGAALSYTFLLMAVERGDTAKIVTFTYLSPFLAIVFISIFLNEPVRLSSVVGLALITLGIFLQNRSENV